MAAEASRGIRNEGKTVVIAETSRSNIEENRKEGCSRSRIALIQGNRIKIASK